MYDRKIEIDAYGKNNIVIFVTVTLIVFVFWNVQSWFQYRQKNNQKSVKSIFKDENESQVRM